MNEAQGPDIAALQSSREHQEANGEKSGFGMGLGDPYSTVLDGGKWTLNIINEGLYAAYVNILEAWVSGCNLDNMWKSVNIFGIKFFENITEHFVGGAEGMPQEYDGADYHPSYHPDDDFQYADAGLARHANGLHDVHDMEDYHGQYFYPSPSPSPSPSAGVSAGVGYDDGY